MALSSKRAPLAGRRKSTENVEKATKKPRNMARHEMWLASKESVLRTQSSLEICSQLRNISAYNRATNFIFCTKIGSTEP